MDLLRSLFPSRLPERPAPPGDGSGPTAAAAVLGVDGAVGGKREVFIDVARSLAIFGALTLHCLLTFKVWDQVPVGLGKAVGNGIFRACTPTFFLLFGVMLEWVYVRQREREGAPAMARRLLRRSGQCYLGMVLGAVGAVVGGGLTVGDLPAALDGLVDVPMSSVLRFYALALLLCIPVVALRPRLGPHLPLMLVAVIWGAAPLLPLLPWPGPASPWAFPCAFLVGQPPMWVIGSVWHNLSLVFLGMALGHHMRSRLDSGLSPLGGWPVWTLAGVCVVVAAASAALLGPAVLAQGYFGTAMYLRVHCHPAYFAIAVLSALALLWVVQRRFPAGSPAGRRWPLMALGRHSLLAFAVGNAGLNLLAGSRLGLGLGTLATFAYMCALSLLMGAFDNRLRK